jgi:uracil-DNA glycosylase
MTDPKFELFATLQTEMRACRLCMNAGFEAFPDAVTQGKVDAKIMTVGQAPGVTEIEAKRPFNAGSGKRLFEWLGAAGIEEDWFRSTQYMTSVTKCFPGKAKNGGGDRVPSKTEQEFCRPFFERELEIVNPSLIIPIGKLAIAQFFPKNLKLTEVIGTEGRFNDAWVVPLPHSSGASRWHQIENNRILIEKAINLIRGHYQNLFVK